MASRLLPIRGLATDAEPGDFSDVMKFCAGGSRSPTSGSRPRPNVASAVGEVPELDALKDVLQRFLAQEQAHLVRRVAELEEAMLEVLRGTVEPPVHVANQPLLPCGAAAQAAEAELSVSIPLERPVFLAPDAVRFEVGHISEGSGLKHHQHVTISPAHSVAMSQPTSPGSTRHGAMRNSLSFAESKESSTTAGPALWLPTKEATHEAFNRLADKVDGNPIQKAFRKALRNSGLDLEPMAAPNTRCPRLLRFVRSRAFVGTVMALIALNAIFICITADQNVRRAAAFYDARSAGRDSGSTAPPLWQEVMDISFTSLFTLELLLRILAEEWYFWVGVEWRWNLFDTILVLSMLTDTVLVLIGLDMSYIRLLRLLRALRSFRIIRVLRFFRELRVMLLSIMNSIAPLLWAIVFLALTIGVFSIVFLQGVTSFIHDALSSNVSIEGVRTYYSSFPMASFSLFMAITGGDDWWNLVRPLLEISEVYAVLFVLYISLMVLGVMNIITGIFVESATELSRLDRDLVTQAEQERMALYMKELRKLFMELDTNRDGTITLQEFESFAARADVQAYFSVLELDITKAAQVFRLLDLDGSHELQLDEFVMGCMRLKGMAKGIDLETLMLECRKLASLFSKHRKLTKRQFARLEEMMAAGQREHRAAVHELAGLVASKVDASAL